MSFSVVLDCIFSFTVCLVCSFSKELCLLVSFCSLTKIFMMIGLGAALQILSHGTIELAIDLRNVKSGENSGQVICDEDLRLHVV